MGKGHVVIGGYFLASYVVPMMANLAFAENIVSSYTMYPLTWECVAVVAAVYLLFALFDASKIPLAPAFDVTSVRPPLEGLGRLYVGSRMVVAVVALPIGVASLLAGQTSYRYSDEAISAAELVSLAMLLATIVLNVVITVDFVYRIFVSREAAAKMGWRRTTENVLLALALVMTANGILSLFQALIALVWSLQPPIVDRLLFTPTRREQIKMRDLLKRGATAGGSAIVYVAVLLVAWYYGTLIKVSSSEGLGMSLFDRDLMMVLSGGVDEGSLRGALYNFVERYSIFYYSLLYTIVGPTVEQSYDAVSTLAYPLQTLLFRVDYLLGGPFEIVKPEVGSIAQLNYRLLTAGVLRIREGSAPGLIASFNYVLAFPLNIVCCALYLRWLSNRVEALLSGQRHRRLSLLGVLLLITFLQVFFQSPFDFLMLIDDAVIYMVLLVGLSVAQREVRAEREPAAPLVRKATGMGVI